MGVPGSASILQGQSAVCAVGYSDVPLKTPDSGAALLNDCRFCAPGYANRAAAPTSPSATATPCRFCAIGYSNSANSVTPSDPSDLECNYCALGYSTSSGAETPSSPISPGQSCGQSASQYILTAPYGLDASASIPMSQSAACSLGYSDAPQTVANQKSRLISDCVYCAPGYTNLPSTETPAAPSTTACDYCATGYSTSSGAPSPGATPLPVGQKCRYSSEGYFLTAPYGVPGSRSVPAGASNAIGCDQGYTDIPMRAPSAPNLIRSDCTYCARGYANRRHTSTHAQVTTLPCSFPAISYYLTAPLGISVSESVLLGVRSSCANGYSDVPLA